MIGLVVGLARMVIEFTHRAPLCMEEDHRPFWIGQVLGLPHYCIKEYEKSFSVPDPLHVLRGLLLLANGYCGRSNQSFDQTR